ncbi:ATP-binding protein [Nocardiopsis sediminis]|uniref:ATP-binding protein n=1 Tax=Nocardiopsis sediminis TaxID=1778267 RepID=A0ABV8FFI7_9ACTN
MTQVIPRPTLVQPGWGWGPAADVVALPGTPESPGQLRTWVAERLRTCGRPYAQREDLADALRLVASELASNAIAHSASGQEGAYFITTVHFPHDTIGLRVMDQGPHPERPTRPQEPPHILSDADLLTAEHGRGLALIAVHSRRYGWTEPPGHPVHSVWVELELDPEEAA